MHWVYLIAAILLEVSGTTFMKMSDGFTKLIPSILMFASYALCFTSLAFSLKQIEVSVAYAIWSGVGIVLISIIGMMYFSETVNTMKVLSTLFIIIGVIGLNLSTSH